jgi:putative membrane protein
MPRRGDILAINRSCLNARTAAHVVLCRIDKRSGRARICLCAFDAGNGWIGAERMRTIGLILLVMLCSPNSGFAHELDPHANGAVWTFDPWIVVPLFVAAGLYAVGSSVLWHKIRSGSQHRRWRTLAFLAGWLTLLGALVSPLHWLGEHLFTFHMIEHEILMAVSAPLLVLASPIGIWLWSLPRTYRFKVGRFLRRPLLVGCWQWMRNGRNATLVHGVAIWAWHAPILFDAAVTNIVLHRLQHLSFLLTAIVFWWSVLRNNNAGLAAWHLFVTMLHTSVLGALMALAPRVLYQAQTATAADWRLTPLEDQQLAGIIMWVPAGTIYAGAALAMLTIWIGQSGATRRHSDALNAL